MAELAVKDKNLNVRIAAVGRLSDQILLVRFGLKGKSGAVCRVGAADVGDVN